MRIKHRKSMIRDSSSVGRALGSHSRGQGFDSLLFHIFSILKMIFKFSIHNLCEKLIGKNDFTFSIQNRILISITSDHKLLCKLMISAINAAWFGILWWLTSYLNLDSNSLYLASKLFSCSSSLWSKFDNVFSTWSN